MELRFSLPLDGNVAMLIEKNLGRSALIGRDLFTLRRCLVTPRPPVRVDISLELVEGEPLLNGARTLDLDPLLAGAFCPWPREDHIF